MRQNSDGTSQQGTPFRRGDLFAVFLKFDIIISIFGRLTMCLALGGHVGGILGTPRLYHVCTYVCIHPSIRGIDAQIKDDVRCRYFQVWTYRTKKTNVVTMMTR